MTTNETVDILTTYRERLKSQYEKPGWNKWALLGALASLTWLLITMREGNNLETKDSIKLLISVLLCETLFNQILAAFSLSSSKFKTKYIEFKKELPNRYPSILFQTIVCIGSIVYSHIFIDFKIKGCNTIYFGFLYLNLVVNLLIPLVMMIAFPFPIEKVALKEAKWFKNIFLILILFTTSCCIYFLISIIGNWTIVSMWKSCFIFLGFYFVLNKIIETIQKSPLIDEIDYIIDELVFNKMDSETALTNLKLILSGLELKDAISPILIEYFNIEKSFREKIGYINQIAIKINEERGEIKRKVFIDELNTNIEQFKTNELLTLNKFTKKVGIRLSIYTSFDHNKNEMQETIEQINKSTTDLGKQMQAAQTIIDKINNKDQHDLNENADLLQVVNEF